VRTAGWVFFAWAVAASTLQAQNFSFEGTFSADDQVQLFNFTLASTETVTFQTWSYGGGKNAANQIIPAGGFESLLTWFGPDGSVIGNSAPYGCGAGNLYLFDCLDSYADPTLPAGTYTLALTVYDNAAVGDGNPGDLALGFIEQGQPNFTAVGSCTQFCDSNENQDDGNWAVDVLNVSSASLVGVSATPEPVTMLLAGGGLALIGLAKYRRAAKKSEKSPASETVGGRS
jgi:hypothetical protein